MSRFRWFSFRVFLVLLFLVWWFVLRIEERPSWPPLPDAVTAAQARAESTIHILMFSMTPGEVADSVVDVLVGRAEGGVEIRMVVDRYGAKVYDESQPLFDRLQAAGVKVVVNDIFPVDRDGPLGSGKIDWWQDELGNADHRKMLVIDGEIGWIGGAGFEDHFADGRYHDTFARMTGDILRQMQLVFLTSFHVLGGPAPEDGTLERYFPEPDDRGTIPATLLHNVPDGFVPGTQAIGEIIDSAHERLDILNPYLTDPGMLDRVIDAGQRGVDVTVVVPGTASNVPPARDALQHNYARLSDASVGVFEYDAVMHAKVIVADDTVIIGTINLDAWALYRNHEIAVLIDDPAVAQEARNVLLDDALSRSAPAESEDGIWNDVQNWFWDKLVYFL